MATYIHELDDWPAFRWDVAGVAERLGDVRHRQGRLIGRMEAMGLPLRTQASLQTLTEDVLKTSEIEGEILDTDQVRSSLAHRLGVDIGALAPSDRHVDGIVDMMLDATQTYQARLTSDRLFGWHASLFPTGRSGMARMTVGGLRRAQGDPMQVVSGPLGRERVHFQAPEAGLLAMETARFLRWFNDGPTMDPVLKAAVAHLWFVTLHPFDDGNGRIARTICDMALARSENSPQRFYSLSAQIRIERAAYYEILERTQKGDLDITDWLQWFLGCLDRAFDGADATLAAVLKTARFWEAHADALLNTRQRKGVNRLLSGFEGKLTSSKWAAMTACSQDTALRDIDGLVTLGMLVKDPAGGRSTGYSLT